MLTDDNNGVISSLVGVFELFKELWKQSSFQKFIEQLRGCSLETLCKHFPAVKCTLKTEYKYFIKAVWIGFMWEELMKNRLVWSKERNVLFVLHFTIRPHLDDILKMRSRITKDYSSSVVFGISFSRYILRSSSGNCCI